MLHFLNSKLTKRYIIVAALIIMTALIVNTLEYKPTQDKKAGLKNIQALPLRIDKWTGKDFPLTENIYEILETRAIIHRSYTADNQDNVFLSIVHYHDTKVDFHAPEACIGGRGFKTQKSTEKITLFPGANQITINIAKMVTTRETGRTLTYYFFKSGQFIGSNYIKMRLSIAANKLTMNDTRGSLIRISTTLNPEVFTFTYKQVSASSALPD